MSFDLIEPSVPVPTSWYLGYSAVASRTICQADRLYYEGHTKEGARLLGVGVEISGELDIVAALQIADHYGVQICGVHGFLHGFEGVILDVGGMEEFGIETGSSTALAYSSLAGAYLGALFRGDHEGRAAVLATASVEEVCGALSVLFVIAHTTKMVRGSVEDVE